MNIYIKNFVICLILILGFTNLIKAKIINTGKEFTIIINNKVKNRCS
jgi:hypothetical protein